MKTHPLSWLARLMVLAVVFFPAVARGQETEEQIQKRLAARQASIRVLKAGGKVGETAMGQLAPVKDADGILNETFQHEGKAITIREFVAAENADRTAVYALIAARESTPDTRVSAEFVAERSGTVLIRKAEPGDWIKDKEGKWVQKPKRRD